MPSETGTPGADNSREAGQIIRGGSAAPLDGLAAGPADTAHRQGQGVALDEKTLVELYKAQWDQIRHLDQMDTRAFLLVPAIVGALNLLFRVATPSAPGEGATGELLVPLGVIEIGLAWLGIYTVVRNWLCYQRRFIILGEIERAMGLVKARIVPADLQFRAPSGFLGFGRRLLFSMRGPMAIFYGLLIWAGFFTLFSQAGQVVFDGSLFGSRMYFTWGPLGSIDRVFWSAVCAGLLGFLCLAMNYGSVRRELPAVAKDLDLKHGDERERLREPDPEFYKRRAVQYVELAQMHELMRDPQMKDQALSEYYRAWRLDPENVVAKDAIARLEAQLDMPPVPGR